MRLRSGGREEAKKRQKRPNSLIFDSSSKSEFCELKYAKHYKFLFFILKNHWHVIMNTGWFSFFEEVKILSNYPTTTIESSQ